MTQTGAVHRMLRAATRDDHASIDRMLLPFDLHRIEDYRIFLNIHFAALSVLRPDWRRQDSADFGQLLHCAQTDLAILGAQAPLRTLTGPPTSPAIGLGIGYVIRGSRRGAEILRRDVGAGLPTAYLDFVPALSWEEFLIELESLDDVPKGNELAARAAGVAFGVFAAEFAKFRGVTSIAPFK
jgi:heme oxygenase (biliverdin-IX-beta and delta-forming)